MHVIWYYIVALLEKFIAGTKNQAEIAEAQQFINQVLVFCR